MVVHKMQLGSRLLRVEVTSDRFKFISEGTSGDCRFLELRDGGGHFEVLLPGGNSEANANGAELDGDGRVITHAT